MLQNQNILLGVTGGIAAYKTPDLVRKLKHKLVKAAGEVERGLDIYDVSHTPSNTALSHFMKPLKKRPQKSHSIAAALFGQAHDYHSPVIYVQKHIEAVHKHAKMGARQKSGVLVRGEESRENGTGSSTSDCLSFSELATLNSLKERRRKEEAVQQAAAAAKQPQQTKRANTRSCELYASRKRTVHNTD